MTDPPTSSANSTNPPAAGTYAVIGHPIAHSLSPLIHRHFAAETGEQLHYDLLPAPADGFVATAQAFFAAGGGGLNVTLPFKEQAAELVTSLDDAARVAGAVNTIRQAADGRLHGYNTDGAGLLADLQHNLQWPVADARILLIGAGGASRGVLAQLLAAHPQQIVLANRTLERATILVAEVAPAADNVRVCTPADVSGEFDLVINATSASLAGQGALVPTEVIAGARCYDMLYARQQTVFAGWAASFGAVATADGLGMLIEQAAAAFALWRGVAPVTAGLLQQRNGLFAAQQAGAQSLADWLLATAADDAGEDTTESTAQSSADGDSSPASPGLERRKRQFIAGAVCPKCREIDRIVIRATADGREQACVSCGFTQPALESGGSIVPRGKHEGGNLGQVDSGASQPVRLVDPAADKSAD